MTVSSLKHFTGRHRHRFHTDAPSRALAQAVGPGSHRAVSSADGRRTLVPTSHNAAAPTHATARATAGRRGCSCAATSMRVTARAPLSAVWREDGRRVRVPGPDVPLSPPADEGPTRPQAHRKFSALVRPQLRRELRAIFRWTPHDHPPEVLLVPPRKEFPGIRVELFHLHRVAMVDEPKPDGGPAVAAPIPRVDLHKRAGDGVPPAPHDWFRCRGSCRPMGSGQAYTCSACPCRRASPGERACRVR